VTDITDRKKLEETLSRYAAIVETTEDAIISETLDGIVTTWNVGAERIFGYTASEIVGSPVTILIPPALREEENTLLRTLRAGGRIEHYETIRLTKAAEEIALSLSISPLKDSTGRVVGFSKIARDISERNRGKRSLAEMTRKLMQAQEQERSRIGRELHDDINQRLAMLAIELEKPHDPSEFQNRVQEIRKELRQISDDVQALSHDLDSTKLEYLGVVAGMKSWCKEFAERQKLNVDFRSDLRSVLSLDVGRPLFRVLQEALYNAFKHSGVKRIDVQLRKDLGEILLIVSDLGKGFDLDGALQGKGLGLTSMCERVRLMNGTIVIASKPNVGTTIRVRVPLESEQSSPA
jgi:PAS domain S-box-containing protein